MANKFDLFLNQIEINQSTKKGITLNEVLVKTKTLVFDITFDKVIPAGELSLFINQLQTFFKKPEVVYNIDYKFSFKETKLDEYYQGYYDLICIKAMDEYPNYAVFKNYKPKFLNNVYTLVVEKGSEFLKNYFEVLKSIFLKHGLDVEINLEVNENLASVYDQVQKTISEQQQSLSSIKKPKVIVDEKIKFTKKSSPDKVLIREIPTTQYELDKYKHEKGDTNFLIEGEVFFKEVRKLRRVTLGIVSVYDETDAIQIKMFINNDKQLEMIEKIEKGDVIQASGFASYDTYGQEVNIMTREIYKVERPTQLKRVDRAKNKRIEFGLHSKATQLDAVTDINDYVDTLIDWGHEAVGLTDLNGAFAFPDFYKATKGKKIKPIYGVQLRYGDPEDFKIALDYNNDFNLKEKTYVVFDIETTGLSQTRDKIIEIAAYKISGGLVVDRFEELIDPGEKLLKKIVELTNITDEMLIGKPKINEVLPKFHDFIKDSCLVAHNATFDIGFLYENFKRLGIDYETFPVIDTLNLSRYFYNDKYKEINHARYYITDNGKIPELKRFNLKALTRFFKVTLDSHHRATHDAYALSEVFLMMLQNFYKEEIMTYYEINASIDPNLSWHHLRYYHAVIYATNQEGYKNLFKIISDSLTNHLDDGPKLLKPVFDKYKEGLIIGSATYLGEVFEAALNKTDADLEEAIQKYDFIFVHPINSYKHLFEEYGNYGKEVIQATIKKIIDFSKKYNKLVAASGDVYYLNKEDKVYRDIFVSNKSLGGGLHHLALYNERPDSHLLTTDEMLDSFSYLDSNTAYDLVIENPKKLNKSIDYVKGLPDDLYSLEDDAFKNTLGIESVSKYVEDLVYEEAHKKYGKNLNPIISDRISKELNNIIKNKFAPIYFISHILVKQSLKDGYLVGSRGSVGSSLVATLLDITEVNPLPPHYYCPNGDFTLIKMTEEETFKYGIKKEEEFLALELNKVKSGYDLKDHNCPYCQAKLKKDGHDIAFETFLGYKGDKVPDIDLNFSGEYQSKAHEYVRELLGEEYTYRAGTIQTVADRFAYGYSIGYLESKEIINVRKTYVDYLARGITGVKRSTGQHPGGIIVVPKDKSIYDVTPIQYPADDKTSPWKTTHFDYHSFEDNLLKLDILGHDDPTMIKFLMDHVKIHPDDFPFDDAKDIPLDDPKVYKLFSDPTIIGIKNNELYGNIASYGIPEFGTNFTRQMLDDTKPKTFAGLVKISGLSHGTDVWYNNAKDLVSNETTYGEVSFDDIIGCRDDIMTQLIDWGIIPEQAFEIMEFVRRGLPSKNINRWTDYEAILKANNVPDWYIWSASLIKYLFPKAHATAYVIMAMRIAWFKVHSPLLFYSAFFSKRCDQFDHDVMVSGANGLRNKIVTLLEENSRKVKDENLLTTLYVAYEMSLRGFNFLPVDINKSDSHNFIMEEKGLRMPFITIDGLGDQAARNIIKKRSKKPFTSLEDIRNRARINKTVFEKLIDINAFGNLPDVSDTLDIGIFSTDI